MKATWPNGKYQIYKLIYPITNDVFYIGQTRDKLKIRFGLHICASKHRKRGVSEYIDDLYNEGITPIMEFIEETEDKDREYFWIDYYLSTGKLKNILHRNYWINKRNDKERKALIG